MTREELEAQKYLNNSVSYGLMRGRLGLNAAPSFLPSSLGGVNHQEVQLNYQGGLTQQARMIRDKRRTLDKAVLYSYQGAFVKKFQPIREPFGEEDWRDRPPVRALINPDKNKMDYDDKIISIGFEHGFHTGDIFEWVGTNTYWLIHLQELTELAYFRAEIRRCSYEIKWLDEDGNEHSTFAAIRGPVETKINYIQKHGISVDTPNYSLHILMPLTEDNKKQFTRYSKFYLQNDEVCWRVEATDWISTPDILEITAVEYYANETEDDIKAGLVGALKVQDINPNPNSIEEMITGETFIKPKTQYNYQFHGVNNASWRIEDKYPVTWKVNPNNPLEIALRWERPFSGQFELSYGPYTKTIIIQSLF